MRKITSALVFLFLTSNAFADAPGSWRNSMSSPHVQPIGNSRCPTYAAIHCMEGLYNYYDLNNPLEIDEYVFLPPESGGVYTASSSDLIFQKIMNNDYRVKPIVENEYPNLAHSYFSVADYGFIPSSSGDGYSYNSVLQNLIQHVDNWGPVCLKIIDYPKIANDVANWDSEDDPIIHSPGGVNWHWVVVVDHGENNEYLECFNSYPTQDNHFFKISTANFSSWAGASVWASLHDRETSYDYDRIFESDPNLNFYYAPKIYPYLNKYIHTYDDFTEYLQFFEEDEEVYVLADTQLSNAVTITGDPYNCDYWPNTVKINVGTEFIPGGGYSQYRNDLIASYPLTLEKCIIDDWGGSDYSGAVYVPVDGSLTINGNVTIQDLEVGIYTKGNNLSITGTNNRILNCSYDGIVLDNASNASIEDLLINNIEHYGMRIIGSNSAGDADKITIANANYGIYLNANADLEIVNSNIGLSGNEIQYDRLIQGGYGTSFVIDNCNITFDRYNYFGMRNNYDYVSVSSDYWGTNDDNDKQWVFSTTAFAQDWQYRASTTILNIGASASPKIVAPSPFELARTYESVEDWTNAKNSYLQAIAQSNDSMLNKRSLKGLLRIYKEQEWPANELRIIARKEYSNAENKHKPVFDFLYNETYVAEKDYFTAIEMFEICAKKYAGTSVEVEMLSRIANMHGDYLDDPAAAKRYADRAVALNPGQPILMSAYMSAGIWYNPDEYTNKFEDVLEYYDIPDEHDTELTAGNDVTVTPNPFNPSTVIDYTLTSPTHVELSIYSITGQKVATLVNGQTLAGRHSVTFNGANLASGIYLYRFESATMNKTGKLMLMK